VRATPRRRTRPRPDQVFGGRLQALDARFGDEWAPARLAAQARSSPKGRLAKSRASLGPYLRAADATDRVYRRPSQRSVVGEGDRTTPFALMNAFVATQSRRLGIRRDCWWAIQQRTQPRKALGPRVSHGEPANGRGACFRPHPQPTTDSGRVPSPLLSATGPSGTLGRRPSYLTDGP
jgi:hypothetical protein